MKARLIHWLLRLLGRRIPRVPDVFMLVESGGNVRVAEVTTSEHRARALVREHHANLRHVTLVRCIAVEELR